MVPKATPTEEQREDFTLESLNREVITKILGTVTYDQAFYFYEDMGKPTGDFAISLSDFCNKISTVVPKCMVFHIKRGDFENWIREVLGDTELAQRISKLKTSDKIWKKEVTLRDKLHSMVKDRVNELRDIWTNVLTWPELAST